MKRFKDTEIALSKDDLQAILSDWLNDDVLSFSTQYQFITDMKIKGENKYVIRFAVSTEKPDINPTNN